MRVGALQEKARQIRIDTPIWILSSGSAYKDHIRPVTYLLHCIMM